jgi:hypothetical protein
MNEHDFVFFGFHHHEKLLKYVGERVTDLSFGIIDNTLYDQLAFLRTTLPSHDERVQQPLPKRKTKQRNPKYTKHKHTKHNYK